VSRLYWARNDGLTGHVWLSEADRVALAREMLLQGMGDFPVAQFERGERMRVTIAEIEQALAEASSEPVSADARLWSDWLAFLAGAAQNGGLLVR
jgi:hypothetical protein